MRYFICTIILFFFCAIGNSLSAQIIGADKAIAAILSEEEETMDAAVDYLAVQYDSSTFSFINAAVNNNLYQYNGIAVSVEQSQGTSIYYQLYPEYRILDSSIEKEDLTPVKLSRNHRLRFNDIMPVINLYSSDNAVRKAAYLQIASSGNGKTLTLLEEKANKEQDEDIKEAALQALNLLWLKAGNATQQQTALNHFSKQKTGETLAILSEYVAREDINSDNKATAQSMVDSITKSQKVAEVSQNIFSGLSLGSVLILVALGLSIIYGLAGIINMSHGEFIMIGAYTTYCIQQLFISYLPQAWLDMAFFISLPASFIVAALFGLLIERLIIRHLYNRPLESLLATWGISLILIQLARNIFGDLTSVKAPAILSGGFEITDGLILPYNRLFIMGLSVVMFILVYLLFQKTRLGIKIRAVTQNRDMSACMGISTKKIDMTTFMLGSGLAGIAGCAITLIGNVVPNMGQTYIVDSFLVVVTGGVGKLVGCVASGLSIGIFSKLFEIGFEAVYGKVLLLVLIILFLQYKPKGLFPDKGRIGDD